jgi:hypothetical protein
MARRGRKRTAKRKKTWYESYITEVIDDILKEEQKLITQAAQHVRKKVRHKIKRRGISKPGEPPGKFKGNLYKGIKVKGGRPGEKEPYDFVGFVAPAYHAWLLEMGTRHMAARPSLGPTFYEEMKEIQRILLQPRV